MARRRLHRRPARPRLQQRRPRSRSPRPPELRRRLVGATRRSVRAIGRIVNRFELVATLIQRDVVRYTPAGLPLVDCVLHHVSEASEAGGVRQVELEAPAIAFEAVARRLAEVRLDRSYRFVGFVANRSRKSKRTVFHITEFESFSNTDQED